MKKIFIATSSFGSYSNKPLEILRDEGYKVSFNSLKRKLTQEELRSNLNNVEGVIAGTELYDENLLNDVPSLKVISRLGVGLDNIDLEFIKKNKLKLFKTNTAPTLAVAELSLGLMLDLNRKISLHNLNLKQGEWKKRMGSLLSGKTLGIIGLGVNGKKLIEITSGLNLKYIAFDIFQDKLFAKKNNVKYCSLNELLEKSDIISIHVNLSKETKNMINASAFKLLKKDAILINTSRGEVINEEDMLKALDAKLIGGIGLDVFNEEPYNGDLTKYENVILTPHIGSYAKEIRNKMEIESVNNLIKGFNAK